MLSNNIKKIFLLAGDIFMLILALYITLNLRYFNSPENILWDKHIKLFLPIFLIYLLVFYINSLYDFRKFINQEKLIVNINRSILISSLLSIVFLYLIPNQGLSPKTNLIIFSLVFYIFFLIWRLAFSILNHKYLPSTNVGIIGYNETIRQSIKLIRDNNQLGYSIKFILAEKNHVMLEIAEHYQLNLIDDVNLLTRAIKDHKINILVLEKNISEMKDLQKTLFNLLPTGINYYSLSKFYEQISGQIPLDILNKSWFLENLNLANKKTFERAKRLYDVFFSFIFLLISLPFGLIIALLVRLSGKGPIIFEQVRLGKNSKKFKFYKFRTMRSEDNDFSPTQENDKRITKIGSFLRQSRLDEIPQLWNVLRGDMSFVGPRPERPELVKKLASNIPFYNIRHLVKPGITGWDQISGEYHSPSTKDTYKKLQYDLYYLKNRSISLDTSIILKTIKTALMREGR